MSKSLEIRPPKLLSSHYGVSNSVDTFAVGTLALTVVFCSTVWAFFVPPRIGIDEVGLFNPIYMYVTTGHVSYPSYGDFYDMVVHPPTHYFVLGFLARIGIPMAYIGSIPPFLLLLIVTYLVFFSRFPTHAKLALLFGSVLGSLFIYYSSGPAAFGFSFRPELHLTFAWFAGLVSLETGRLDNWNPKRLFLGSLLLTYAATLHYWASLAWLGVLVYFVPLFLTRQNLNATKPIAAMVAGSCLAGIPYLTFFVIPKWADIMAFVRATDAVGGLRASIDAHLILCKQLYATVGGEWLGFVFVPQRFGVMPVILSTIALLFFSSTRMMALASLPLQLFVLLMVQRKWPVYMFPELMTYVSGLVSLALFVVFLVVKRLGQGVHAAVVSGTGLILCIALLFGTSWLHAAHLTWRPRVLEHEVARAAGKRILGPNALVGARLSRSYTNGGAFSYMLEPDVLWGPIGERDLKAYFKNFDAIAEDAHGSDLTNNDLGQSLSSWYAGGLLSLRGFFFSPLNVHVSYLLLHADWDGKRQGYGLVDDRRVAHFTEDQSGSFVFVAARCERGQLGSLFPDSLFHSSYSLPASNQGPTESQSLETFVVPFNTYQKSRPGLSSGCRVREEFRLTREDLDVRDLLSALAADQPIRFFEHLVDAVETRYGTAVEVKTTSDGWPDGVTIREGPVPTFSCDSSDAGFQSLFRSDMNDPSEWQVNRYGRVLGLDFQSEGLATSDTAARYSSGDPMDHLSSPFLSAPAHRNVAIFSVWAKPDSSDPLPELRLQNEKFGYLSSARKVMTRPDGWVLIAGWAELQNEQKIRLVVTQRLGTTSLLDKALLVVCLR